MLRQKFVLITILFLYAPCFYAQTIVNVNFDEVKRITQDSSSSAYYPKLLNRLRELDTTLTLSDFKLLYYGNVFTDNYNPYDFGTKREDRFNELYKAGNLKEALAEGKQLFEEHPVNIRLLYRLMNCCEALNEMELGQKFANCYFGLIYTILGSGNGNSIETAYVVTRVPDEYSILNHLHLNSIKQALVGYTDVLTINQKLQKKVKGKKKVKELYFNVQMPYQQLSKMLKKSGSLDK
jgi:tetratricopeptide (TPR) repeat protein